MKIRAVGEDEGPVDKLPEVVPTAHAQKVHQQAVNQIVEQAERTRAEIVGNITHNAATAIEAAQQDAYNTAQIADQWVRDCAAASQNEHDELVSELRSPI